ncbi:phosphoribosylaminoimidazole carboxylase [Tanacetum coccineum]
MDMGVMMRRGVGGGGDAVMDGVEGPGEADFIVANHIIRRALCTPGVTIHCYDKPDMPKHRKMGHITIVGLSMGIVKARVKLFLKEGSAADIPDDDLLSKINLLQMHSIQQRTSSMEHKQISSGSVVPPLSPKYPWFVAQNLEAEEDDAQPHTFFNLHDPLSHYRCKIPELLGKRIRVFLWLLGASLLQPSTRCHMVSLEPNYY